MSPLRWLFAVVMLAVIPVLAGCLSLERPAPEVRRYMLDVRRPAGSEPAGDGARIVEVTKFSAAAEAQQRGFLFRVSDAEVQEDYYHRWVADPAEEIRQATVDWLMASPLVDKVVGASAPGVSFMVHGHLKALRADVRGERAVEVEVLFTFMKVDEEGESSLAAQYVDGERVAVDRVTPEALVEGWNRAVTAVLGRMEERLAEEFAGR